MQSSDGSMRLLEKEEIKTNPEILTNQKVLREGQYFKIQRCYFKIAKITPEGIEAKGVSRREYFNRR